MKPWTTPTNVVDALHDRFGVGTFDPESDMPLWKQKMTEVSKVKAMMKKRNVSIEDLQLTFEYADAARLPITESWHLFQAIPDAKAARRRFEEEQAATTSVRARLDAALQEAQDLGHVEWAEALLRAEDGSGGEALLVDWEAKREGIRKSWGR